jgi:hypothetical protein
MGAKRPWRSLAVSGSSPLWRENAVSDIHFGSARFAKEDALPHSAPTAWAHKRTSVIAEPTHLFQMVECEIAGCREPDSSGSAGARLKKTRVPKSHIATRLKSRRRDLRKTQTRRAEEWAATRRQPLSESLPVAFVHPSAASHAPCEPRRCGG